jgi:phosphatidylserine/phosphatidylglycerophosphate/cardiolipin synthase-like enzyme
MAADQLSPPIAQDPTPSLVKRSVLVATGATNTIRVPHDRFFDKHGAWYTAAGGQVVEGNQVKFLIHGSEAFPEMQEAIETATGPDHFIYMLNWFCDVDFDLKTGDQSVPGKPSSPNTRRVPLPNTLRFLLTNASDQGVMIRAMLWKSPIGGQNVDAVRFLNSFEEQMTVNGLQRIKMVPPLSNSAAIHDDIGDEALLKFLEQVPILSILKIIPRAIGSQHQKVLCVSGEQGLVCFCGGIDFNPDRVSQPGLSPILHSVENKATPLHDVHCRIVGPAAAALVQTFADRWNSHPTVQKLSPAKRQLKMPPQSGKAGEHFVQIGRTFRRGLYSFNPAGEFTASEMIAHAIGQAKRYIYTECQYFTGDPTALGGDGKLEKALTDALKTIEHLTIVVTHWELSDLPSVNSHRRKFFQSLIAAGGDKVRIFSLQPAGNPDDFKAGKIRETYVHAKIWVMDDEFAVIGSVNSNRRSWLHDSEVAAGIYDTSTDTVLRYRLAHKFRIKLWAEHLNMPGPQGEAELADGVASGVHWLHPLAGARVRPYDLSDHGDIKPFLGFLWDGALDPSH